MKLGWLRHMGQSVDSGFKATAVPTWGPRIPPAIGNSAVCLQNQLFVYINFAPCTIISCTYILSQNLDVSKLAFTNVTNNFSFVSAQILREIKFGESGP